MKLKCIFNTIVALSCTLYTIFIVICIITSTINNATIRWQYELDKSKSSLCNDFSQGKYNLKQFDDFKRRNPYFIQQANTVDINEELNSLYIAKKLKLLRAMYSNFDDSQVNFAMDYSYDVQYHRIVQEGCKHYTLLIVLHEYRKGSLTSGGSGYRVRIHSFFSHNSIGVQSCAVLDTMNGLYTIRCQMPTNCIRLSIELMFVNYNVYRCPIVALEISIFNAILCQVKNRLKIASSVEKTSPSTSDNESTTKKQRPINGWLTWPILKYTDVDNIDYPIENMEVMCAALELYDRIYLMGASHMERTARFIDIECKNGVKKHKLMKLRRMKEFKRMFHTVLSIMKSTNSGNNAFLIQTGIWDICYVSNSYDFIFNDMLQQFVLLIDQLLHVALHSGEGKTRIVIINTPARYERNSQLSSCNNNVVSIFNLLLRNEIEKRQTNLDQNNTNKVDLRFVDTFELSLPVYNQTTPDHIHYVDCSEEECTGVVGKVLIQKILKEL